MRSDHFPPDDCFLPSCWCQPVEPSSLREIPQGHYIGVCDRCGSYALLPIEGDTRIPVAFVVFAFLAAMLLAAAVVICRGAC